MKQILLQGTQLSVSRFIFGTASLFNISEEKQRQKLLETAICAGFTHFDTAPYYGFGWAERDLAQVLQRHPHVTITTKVGLYSPGGEGQSRISVLLRKGLGRIFPTVSRPEVDYTLVRAQQALAKSLQRLGRTHIELYLLHEPDLQLIATEEWRRWLELEVARGRIGTFGVALTRERLIPLLEKAPELAPVVQLLDSLGEREADCLAHYDRAMQITYGYVSSGLHTRTKPTAMEILAAALERNKKGAIIVSTKKAHRIQQYSDIVRAHS